MLVRKKPLVERWQFQCDASVISVSATPNCSVITAATVGRTLYALSSDGDLLWKFDSNNGLKHECWSTAISADGSIVAVGTANKKPSDGAVHILDSKGEVIFQETLGAPVWSLSLSEDGGTLAAACWNGTAYRFNRTKSTYKLTAQFSAKTASGLYGITVSKRGDRAVVCAYDTGLIVLNERWKEEQREPSGAGLYNISAAEGVQTAIAGQRDGSLLFYDYSKKGRANRVQVEGCARPICGVACSNQAQVIACGSFDGWIYLVNRKGATLDRHETEGEVWSVACSEDAAIVCVGSGDHTVRFLENCCSVAPLEEVTSLEAAVERIGSGAEVNLSRLLRLYGQYGLYEYGYNNLKRLQAAADEKGPYRRSSQELLEQALKVAPENHWAHYELGLIAKECARYPEAIHHFQEASSHPEFASRAMTNCADTFSSLRLPTATASCYRRARAQDIDGDAKRVLYNLGRSYEDVKQWPEAISHYQLLASWDVSYRNTWYRLQQLLAVHVAAEAEAVPPNVDYTGISTSLLGPDSPREIDATLRGVLKARTAEVLIEPGEREKVASIISKLRGNAQFSRGITGVGLDYSQRLFLKYDFALPEDETKKFLETVNLLYLVGNSQIATSLDIGSATGRYPSLMKWLGSKAHGIDIELEAIEYANNQKQSKEWPKYQVLDARKLRLKKLKYSLVTCMMGTFAHIQEGDQPLVLTNMYDALLPGGSVAISTWDMECAHLAYLSIYNETQKDIIRLNSPTTTSMKAMLEAAGFVDIEIRPFCMLPQIVVYDLGIQDLRSGDIQLAAQADLAVRSLYPNKHGEMYLAFARKAKH